MEKEITLLEAIEKHCGERNLRFHMPGHKGRNITGLRGVTEIDFTELPGLDNLHFPSGCIAYSERLAANLFGARETLFLVNGSSAGIIASALALTDIKRPAVCARNCHISLYKGMCLSGARPVYVMPEIIHEYGICGGIKPERVGEALESAGNAGAVFVVSPTYEGFTSDIRAIAEITHKHGAILFVDEAHGSHFRFDKSFPETALEQGADIVVQSWHKTLTALGQGAVLHVGGGMDTERLKFYLSVMQTTSPSYAIMASIDATRELLRREGGPLFKKYRENLEFLREGLCGLKNVKLLSDAEKGRNGIADYDNGKITLCIKGGGKELEAYLRQRGIYIEMSGFDHVVLMTSLADEREEYRALLNTLSEFDSAFAPGEDFITQIPCRIPEMAATPAESLKQRADTVLARAASGRVSAGFITPYPPGIPLVAPGEVISAEVAEFCGAASASAEIIGLINGEYLRVLE